MSDEQPSQAEIIIGFWPGETVTQKRKAMTDALAENEAKTRYWHRIGTIPQTEHQRIIDVAHTCGIEIPPSAFARHLRAPTKRPAAAAAG